MAGVGSIAKRVLMVVGLAAAAVSLVATGALAYRVVAAVAVASVDVSEVEVCLMQRDDVTGRVTAYAASDLDVSRGYESTADVLVANTADEPAWVRVRVYQHVAGNSAVIADGFDVDWAGGSWVGRSDGWWYWAEGPLNPGELTGTLLAGVTVAPGDAGAAYEGKDLVLTVEVQAVQSEHNGTSVFTAVGWND